MKQTRIEDIDLSNSWKPILGRNLISKSWWIERDVDEDFICGGLTNYDSMLKYQKIGEMDNEYPF